MGQKKYRGGKSGKSRQKRSKTEQRDAGRRDAGRRDAGTSADEREVRELKHEIALVGPPLALAEPQMGQYPQTERRSATAGHTRPASEASGASSHVPDGTEINAAHLQRVSGGDMEHPEVREAIALSDEGRLYCCVCSSPLRRSFGSSGSRRWHFALRDAENSPCGHEPESEAHRATKTALYHALVAAIERVLEEGEADSGAITHLIDRHAGREVDPRGSTGWLVSLEKALENGRRPDVMAEGTGSLTGERVAFEVQYADMSREALAARRKDYADLGVRDLWMLGETRLEKGRDLLARELAAAADQRLLYIGPEQIIEALSPLSGETPWGSWDLSAVGSESKRRAERAALKKDGRGRKEASHNPFYRVVATPLDEAYFCDTKPEDDGDSSRNVTGASDEKSPYRSPADDIHHEMQGMYATARRLEFIERAATRYERCAEGTGQASEARSELLALLREDRDTFLASAEAWRLKNAPREVRRILVAQREVDLGVYASGARWKADLYSRLRDGQSEREAASATLKRYGGRERRCWWAIRACLEQVQPYIR